MKTYSLTLVMLLCMSALLQTSCKKVDLGKLNWGDGGYSGSYDIPSDQSIIFQNKNWKIVGGTVYTYDQGLVDWYNTTYDPCKKDDIYRFENGGAYLWSDGLTKCDLTGPQYRQGTWSYDAQARKLQFSADQAGSYQLFVTSFSDTSFAGWNAQIIGGIRYTTTWYFAKQ